MSPHHRTEWLEERHAPATHVAAGTLACPSCDAPAAPEPGGCSPSEPLACGFCGHRGAARDFLSLAGPTRPAHVTVHARLVR